MKRNKLITVIFSSIIAIVVIAAAVTIPLTTPDDEKETASDTEDMPVSSDSDRYNLLLAGTDRTSGLTDVILILSVDRIKQSAAVVQIPRDTYVEYTSGSYKKLNGAYGTLGAEGMCELLSKGLGITLDSYLVLSPDALVEIVDALGGVEVTLEEPMRYSDPEQGLYISLDAGKQVLSGKKAEQFIRYRSGYANGDLGRLDAQKKFLCGLLSSVRKKTDPITVARLTAALIGKADTGITPAEGLRLTETLLSIAPENISLVTAPGEAVIAERSGASYYSLSRRAMGEVTEKYLGGISGGFDPEGIFLNESYGNFKRAYEGYSKYKVYSVKSISEGK